MISLGQKRVVTRKAFAEMLGDTLSTTKLCFLYCLIKITVVVLILVNDKRKKKIFFNNKK